jgi:predicted dehydrogenase
MAEPVANLLCLPALVDDPNIDAVYIALSPHLRYEWALRALATGKHVLIETPCAANAADARRLFESPLVRCAGAPVLLESTPFRFHPSWADLDSWIERDQIIHVSVTVTMPARRSRLKDLRFRHEEASAAGLDMGYATALLRAVYGKDPLSCARCWVGHSAPRNPPP